MKQTAVEWLQEKLNNVKPTQFCSIETIKEWVDQAKEMEKEQIIKAYENTNSMAMYGEQYYNETFKTKNHD